MRINTNVAAINAQRNLSEVQRSVDSSMSKLSSGLRIAKAGDDAAGLTIANGLRSSTRSLSMAAKNAEQGSAMLSIAEGSAQTVQKILERAKELVTQKASANTSIDTTATAAINSELDQLGSEINRIIATTTYNGQAIFSGTARTFQVSDSDSATSNLSATVNLTGITISNATATISAVDGHLATVNTTLQTIGAAQNRLDYTLSNLKSAIQNQSAAESVIRDVDMAEEMAKFSKNNILAQAGQAMLAQANQSSQGVLQLLRG